MAQDLLKRGPPLHQAVDQVLLEIQIFRPKAKRLQLKPRYKSAVRQTQRRELKEETPLTESIGTAHLLKLRTGLTVTQWLLHTARRAYSKRHSYFSKSLLS